jgi:hypothetical protein
MDDNRKAFVTLCSTENYLPAVVVLARSFRKVKSKYPLLVAITEELCRPEIVEDILRKEGCIVETVPHLTYTKNVVNKYGSTHTVLQTAPKIAVFNLCSWDKLVYIDADVLVTQNIDDLMDRMDGSMVKYAGDDMGFSGLFVFSPRNHSYERYLALQKNFDGVDGDLLGYLWFYMRTNPDYVIDQNYLVSYWEHNACWKAKAIHYNNEKKPWLHPKSFNKQEFAIAKYYEYLDQVWKDYPQIKTY